MAKTPIRSPDEMRLTASAMWSPVRSWRTMIVRMSASAAASMMGLTGYPMRNLTPSRLRISATAAAAFMIHSPRSLLSSPRVDRNCLAPAARGSLILRQTRRSRGDEVVVRAAGPAGAGAPRPEANFMKDDREEPMTREELKHRVDEAIERHADEIVAVGEAIRRHPELGFKELRTSALVETKFRQLGRAPRTGLAITGVRADAAGGAGSGPTFALVGELDALVVAGHPEAARSTGAVHACGHNAQIAGLVGAAIGLVRARAMDRLAGRVAFMAVPAEEGGDLEWRLNEVRAGRLELLGGKQELLRLGHLDDVDLAMMIHTTSRPEHGKAGVPPSNTGSGGKTVRYIGGPRGLRPAPGGECAVRGQHRTDGDQRAAGNVPRRGLDPRAS